MISITTVTSAERAAPGEKCGGFTRNYYSDDFSDTACTRDASWVITVESVHAQPTPRQKESAKRGWRADSQRRFATRRAYCIGHIPKRHAWRGLALLRRGEEVQT